MKFFFSGLIPLTSPNGMKILSVVDRGGHTRTHSASEADLLFLTANSPELLSGEVDSKKVILVCMSGHDTSGVIPCLWSLNLRNCAGFDGVKLEEFLDKIEKHAVS